MINGDDADPNAAPVQGGRPQGPRRQGRHRLRAVRPVEGHRRRPEDVRGDHPAGRQEHRGRLRRQRRHGRWHRQHPQGCEDQQHPADRSGRRARRHPAASSPAPSPPPSTRPSSRRPTRPPSSRSTCSRARTSSPWPTPTVTSGSGDKVPSQLLTPVSRHQGQHQGHGGQGQACTRSPRSAPPSTPRPARPPASSSHSGPRRLSGARPHPYPASGGPRACPAPAPPSHPAAGRASDGTVAGRAIRASASSSAHVHLVNLCASAAHILRACSQARHPRRSGGEGDGSRVRYARAGVARSLQAIRCGAGTHRCRTGGPRRRSGRPGRRQRRRKVHPGQDDRGCPPHR